ncbi:MAG: chemotaxis protein CheW [Microcystaceae cyanobacterium]
MLLVLFHLGSDQYAIDSLRVIKMIPLVILKPVSASLSPIAGVFNYGGQLVPVIDLRQLIQGKPCQKLLSTRIILISPPNAPENATILGLMAEKVTDTITKNQQDFTASQFQDLNSLYLGDMIHDDQGMIQYLRLEHLLSELQQKQLIPPAIQGSGE